MVDKRIAERDPSPSEIKNDTVIPAELAQRGPHSDLNGWLSGVAVVETTGASSAPADRAAHVVEVIPTAGTITAPGAPTCRV
jgi:hypothetical protein